MTEDERLYLQFLQNNIARMNTNSVQVKTWCIAIVAALLAIYSETKNDLFLLICIVPVVLFCILDALYLQQEHKFVAMYNEYITNNAQNPNVFKMPMKNYEKSFGGFLKALKSWSILLVYPVLLVVLIGILAFPSLNKDKYKNTTVETETECVIDEEENSVGQQSDGQKIFETENLESICNEIESLGGKN